MAPLLVLCGSRASPHQDLATLIRHSTLVTIPHYVQHLFINVARLVFRLQVFELQKPIDALPANADHRIGIPHARTRYIQADVLLHVFGIRGRVEEPDGASQGVPQYGQFLPSEVAGYPSRYGNPVPEDVIVKALWIGGGVAVAGEVDAEEGEAFGYEDGR